MRWVLLPALVWGETFLLDGLELSTTEDQKNDQPIYKWFERAFFSAVQSADCTHDETGLQCRNIRGGFDEERWQNLISQMWRLVDAATRVPALAHAVAMSLYSWMWWEGPGSDRVNLITGRLACDFFAASLAFNGCTDPALGLQEFYVRNCHMRWRYLMMISSELGRHLALERDLLQAAQVLRQAQGYFAAMRQLPAFGPHAGVLASPHHISLNADYFPASVVQQGPIWSARLPIAEFLEEHFATIKGELLVLLGEDKFSFMSQVTRNAEPQFGPRDDDWLTAYLVRGAQFNEVVCASAPKTCQLLRSRPELAQCGSGLSGSGFLRMRPGGRLKPHFGGAPRLSAHLALLVPDGELFMSVGYQTVRWEEGKVITFDDTFVHSVTHNGREPRYVLNVWMCHPCDPTEGHGAPGRIMPEYCHGPEQGVLPPTVR
ncbi:unnamed protein product [Effrenium voratum]|uniref:Aspartyl/asparaginy/proline hydroxylase domain-containing protein n=1 Tax=Effrenium voratum TaxID=2562239 RepID=A0AA36IK65_9DINO|nr:unnamed protein product [Effrenium voratum]CAJ1388239.1 unnamed protein product [Effrenium voratum]CAJ1431824.1 unnamed protein product [Effrenium voratum]